MIPETTIFSKRVVHTLNSLGDAERTAVAGALASEYILGRDVSMQLPPVIAILYTIVRSYVEHDLRIARQGAPILRMSAL